MLRDLLPFTQPLARLKSNGNARGLLGSLAGRPPLEVASRLDSVVLPAILSESNLHMRFKLLEEARQAAECALPELETLVSQAQLPLSMDASSAAIHTDNALKAMAFAYAELARQIQSGQAQSGLENLFNRSIHRAMALLARRQLLAYRAYALPSAASWQLLHELYRMACAPGAKALDGETGPIELEYLGALLFAFLDPGKLPHADLDTIHACTRQLSPYAIVGETAAGAQNTGAESCFIVPPGEGSPGHQLSRLPPGVSIAGGLIIDCTQILNALDRNISRVPGKPVQPELAASPSLLQNLRVALDGKTSRRFSRTRFKPRADLITGFEATLEFIDGHAFSRRSLDTASRNEKSGNHGSVWSLIDESPDGFLIRLISGETRKTSPGDVVALQPRESSKVHICLVRRVAATAPRLELGLQLLSPQASIIHINIDQGQRTRAIFLHSLPAYSNYSGMIALPGIFTTGQKINFDALGRTLHQQIGKCMESNAGLEFFALNPISS